MNCTCRMNEISEKAVIVLILAISLLSRILAAPFFSDISGGDYFNFLLITKQLVQFKTPFIAKRLPFYPLLLVPGHLGGFPIVWGKFIGVASGLALLVIIYLLGRELKIKKRILYLALIFTSFQSTLFVYSLRPLSHTVFTLEVFTALLLFYRLLIKGPTLPRVGPWCRLDLFLGLLLGAMSMTRHEGFLVAAVIALSWLVAAVFKYQRKHFKHFAVQLLLIAVPLFLIVMPYFVSNYLRFGNFIYSPYVEDQGLNTVTDPESLFVNLEKVKWLILNLWGETGYFAIKGVFVPAVLMLLAWVLVRNIKGSGVFGAMLVLLFWLYLGLRGPFEGVLPLVFFFFSGAMVVGAVKFVIDFKWLGAPALLVLITQTVLILFIQPWARHLQHTFPFWVLFLALGLDWLIINNSSGKFGKARFAILFFAAVAILSNNYQGIGAGAKSHELGARREKPLIQAAQYSQTLDGFIAYGSDSSYVQYYVADKGIYFASNLEIPPISDSHKLSEEEQWAWLLDKKPKYVVTYSEWDVFSVIDKEPYSLNFDLVKKFESSDAGGISKAAVYLFNLSE